MTTYYNYLGQAMAVSAGANSYVKDNGGPNGSAQGHVTLTANPGPSAVDVNGGNFDTLVGGAGDNIFYVNNITDVVQVASGLSGVKSVVSWAGGYTLPDNVQNLTFYGAGNWGAGNGLDNLIVMGGNDQNTMDGGAGNDVLVGGLGENDFQFQVAASANHDVFYNFHPQSDTVRIAGAGFTSFAQIQAAMKQVGADVVLTVDANNSIAFRNIHLADFQAHDFLLPLDRGQLGALTFSDDFNGFALLDKGGQWRTNFGSDPSKIDDYTITSNDEKQIYADAEFQGSSGHALGYNPFSTSNGIMTISAGRFSYADSQYTYGQAYYSGMLNTKGLFMQKYGYFEMKAELPTTLGSWPALWLSQDPYKPGVEADVLEHLAMYPDVNFARSDDAGTVAGHTTYMPALSGFHTYGMLWGPTTTTFYVDDLAVLQVATPASWDKPMYMILDMAMGGWGGPIDDSQLSSAQMKVDWVHVYGLADGSSVVVNTEGSGAAGSGDTTGGGSTTGGTPGQTYTSDNAGDHWTGTAGNDVFNLGRGGDVVAGNGGTDVFKFAETPWAGAHITDFSSDDTLDLSGLLAKSGYAGSDPVADGFLKITDDGMGDAQVWSYLGGQWWQAVTLDHVAASAVKMQGDSVVMTGGTGGSTGGGGTTGGGPTGGGGTTTTGQTYTSDNSGDHWTGTAGNDTFNLGRGGDVVAGAGGADVFKFAETPWAAATITDFSTADDRIDLTGLLAKSGYAGSDAIADGYIKIVDDGHGAAQVWSNLDKVQPGLGWYEVVALGHVSSTSLHMQGAFIGG